MSAYGSSSPFLLYVIQHNLYLKPSMQVQYLKIIYYPRSQFSSGQKNDPHVFKTSLFKFKISSRLHIHYLKHFWEPKITNLFTISNFRGSNFPLYAKGISNK